MTKISNKAAYTVKKPIREDYFVGTDSENNGKTVNFDFERTAKLLNELNGTPILNYIFKTSDNIPLEVLTDGTFLSEGNETNVANISKLYVNKNNFHETNMSDLFRFIAVNREVFVMKLRNSSNLANAVYFKITAATEFQNHFILDVVVELSNTAVLGLINFNVYFFDFELKSSDLAITLPEFNKIVSQTGYSSIGTQITFNPSWVWLIKNVNYSNTTSITRVITPASPGNKRIDVFVVNTLNTFQTISGAETTGSPIKPQIPLDALEVTFCIVGDTGIENVKPIDLSNYATTLYVDSKDSLLSNRITELENAPDIDISGKVDKVAGKQLSDENYTLAEKTKLASFNEIFTTALKTAYDSSVAWIATNGGNLIAHLPRTDNPHNTTKSQVGLGNADNTSDLNKPISTATQTALNLKADKATTYTKTEVNNLDAALVTALKDGVDPSGDTLRKLYNLIQGVSAEVTVANVAARNALSVKQGSNVFVTDDGDGKWALYKATTAGVNATYVKLSDPDLLNALMTATQIKTAYESNSDTNAFTNTLLAKLNAINVNAQKNSDITKAEIEAKLTGPISTHTHEARDVISYALSAPTGDLVVGDTDTFHAPYNFTIINYWIGVKVASAGSSIQVDIKKNGTSITTTKAGINAGSFTSLTGTAPVITNASFTKGDSIVPVISQVGSGESGKSLKIYIEVIKS